MLSRHSVRNAIGGVPTRSVNGRANVARRGAGGDREAGDGPGVARGGAGAAVTQARPRGRPGAANHPRGSACGPVEPGAQHRDQQQVQEPVEHRLLTRCRRGAARRASRGGPAGVSSWSTGQDDKPAGAPAADHSTSPSRRVGAGEENRRSGRAVAPLRTPWCISSCKLAAVGVVQYLAGVDDSACTGLVVGVISDGGCGSGPPHHVRGRPVPILVRGRRHPASATRMTADDGNRLKGAPRPPVAPTRAGRGGSAAGSAAGARTVKQGGEIVHRRSVDDCVCLCQSSPWFVSPWTGEVVL